MERLTPVLRQYKEQYNGLDEVMKASLPWEVIESRLVASNFTLLKNAAGLTENGILYAIFYGHAFIADGGKECLQGEGGEPNSDNLKPYELLQPGIESGGAAFEKKTGLKAGERSMICPGIPAHSSKDYGFGPKYKVTGYRRMLEI